MIPYDEPSRDIPVPIPIFPLKAVLFPGATMPLRIFEERYLRMLAERATVDPIFGISLIVSGVESGVEPTFHPIGTTARLAALNAVSPRLVDVVVIGHRRMRTTDENWSRGYAMAEIEEFPDLASDPALGSELVTTVHAEYQSYLKGVAGMIGMEYDTPLLSDSPEAASFDIASRLPLDTWEQQELLENADPIWRLGRVSALLHREISLLHGAGMAGVPLRSTGDRFTLN